MASMSQNIVDLVGIFVDAMRTTETIISEVDNGDGSITITSNVTAIENGDYIILGTENYLVYDLDKIGGTFKVKATFPTSETTWKTAAPYYYHGTPQTVNKEIDTDNIPTDKARYPAIVLWEIIRQDFDKDPISVVGNTARLTMSFLDTTNKIDWTIEEHYDNVIDQMEDEADRFIAIIKKHPYISRFDDYSYIKHFNWGTFVQDKGHVRYILDENLSGLNLEIALPIKKNCLNKYARLLPSNVPPLPTADGTYKNSDSSFVRLIGGGDTFTAPDIAITEVDGSIVPIPANQNYVCGSAGGSTIYNRPSPPWGNMTSGYLYDEGWQYQNGTYTTGYAQSSGQVQELDNTDLSRLTLKYDSTFANKNRYTDESGGQVFNNLLIDNLHGLMFRRDPVNEEWSTGLTTAATTTYEGFSDWRVVSMTEINTIVSANTYPMNYSPYFAWSTKIPHTCSLRNTTTAQHLRFSVAQLTSLVGNTGAVDLLWVRTI